MNNLKKLISAFAALALILQAPAAFSQGDLAAAGRPAALADSAENKESHSAEKSSDNNIAAPVKEEGADAGSKAKEASAETRKNKTPHNSGYIKAEPIADPAGAPTRVQRPGKGSDTQMPATAPPIASGSPLQSPMPLLTPPPPAPPRERFPSVGQLEQLMFGHSTPNIVVDNRLDKLENAIFQKSNANLDIEQRIKRLKEVIIGEDTSSRPKNPDPYGYSPDYRSGYTGGMSDPGLSRGGDRIPPPEPSVEIPKPPFFPNYGHYDLAEELSQEEAEKFALKVLNESRAQQGLDELAWDELAFKVAKEQVHDLATRKAVSHQNANGENPDVRYSKAGGEAAMVESTIMFPQAENLKPTRELVVKMLEALNTRQDDHECLMFPHATGFSMAFKWSENKRKLFCCTEVVTRHGEMDPIPLEASVGDKIEIKGKIAQPYKFHKITLAWEGMPQPPADDGSEDNEALPYFPPLDYEAHAIKSNRDFDKGVRILQIAGITAAIAGGMFIPPVALAAPLIAATVGTSTPKPVSEIPMKGGVKLSGDSFTHRLTLSNQSKEGIYYLTIWASSGAGTEILPVSRRAIIARNHDSGSDSKDSKKDEDKDKDKDKDEDKIKELDENKNKDEDKIKEIDESKNKDKGKQKDKNKKKRKDKDKDGDKREDNDKENSKEAKGEDKADESADQSQP